MTAEWKGEVFDSGFSKEDEKIYDDAILTLRQLVEKEGKHLDEAAEELVLRDAELKEIIVSDFMKIIVAELHFQEEKSTEEVAKVLGVTVERVNSVREEMIKEIQETASMIYKASLNPGGNA